MKRTVLSFVFDGDRLLMIHKKRGQGSGKWNVPGGKIKDNETPEAAVIRETEEETGIIPTDPKQIGILEFRFPKGNNWENLCDVFIAKSFTGCLQSETEECSAEWTPIEKIPYDKLWDSDRRWLPLVFSGEPLHRIYTFDENDKVIDEKVLD
jgi:8-oxo-dGTP diphosphatase